MPFVELDRRIEQAAGLTLAEIFALHGEDYYRRLERETLERVLAEGRRWCSPPAAASSTRPRPTRCCGAARSRSGCARIPRTTGTAWSSRATARPMADHPQAMAELRRLLAAREPLYAEADAPWTRRRLDAAGVAMTIVRQLRDV